MPKKCVNKAEIQKFIRDNAGAMSACEMALQMDVASSTIFTYANKMAVSLELTGKLVRRKEIDDFIKANHEKMTSEEIGKILGESQQAIRYRAWKIGLKCKPARHVHGDNARSRMPDGKFFNEMKMENWLIGKRPPQFQMEEIEHKKIA